MGEFMKRLLLAVTLLILSLHCSALNIINDTDYELDLHLLASDDLWVQHDFTMLPHTSIYKDMSTAKAQEFFYKIYVYDNSGYFRSYKKGYSGMFMPVNRTFTFTQDENYDVHFTRTKS